MILAVWAFLAIALGMVVGRAIRLGGGRAMSDPHKIELDIVVRLAAMANSAEAWIAVLLWDAIDTIVRLRRRNGDGQ
jgi:hypothetical protein